MLALDARLERALDARLERALVELDFFLAVAFAPVERAPRAFFAVGRLRVVALELLAARFAGRFLAPRFAPSSLALRGDTLFPPVPVDNLLALRCGAAVSTRSRATNLLNRLGRPEAVRS